MSATILAQYINDSNNGLFEATVVSPTTVKTIIPPNHADILGEVGAWFNASDDQIVSIEISDGAFYIHMSTSVKPLSTRRTPLCTMSVVWVCLNLLLLSAIFVYTNMHGTIFTL